MIHRCIKCLVPITGENKGWECDNMYWCTKCTKILGFGTLDPINRVSNTKGSMKSRSDYNKKYRDHKLYKFADSVKKRTNIGFK